MRKLIAWLTEVPGRKRGLAAAAMVLVGILEGTGSGLKAACDAGLLAGGACGLDPAAWAAWISTGNDIVQGYVVPGATIFGVVVGAVGLVHAHLRGKPKEAPDP